MSFSRSIAPAKPSLREAIEAYRKVVAVLPRFQVEAGRDLNYKVCYPRSSFDRQSIAWDLNYFKYYFLRLAGIPFNEQALEDDFGRLTKFLLSADRDYFLYRDFQSRNVMLRDGQPFFLDYQGGRKGALQYDIASLFTTARPICRRSCARQLLDYYLDCLAGFIQLDREAFMEHYYAYVYVRIMQALGAYGFRGFYERKAHFLQSVPYALKNLRWLLHHVKLPIALPALMEAFKSMLGSEKLQGLASAAESSDGADFQFLLSPRACPNDETGNGGGFVFDARSLPNPGREERFRTLTGKDAAVIDYLDQQESVHQFLASVMSLVDASVSSYQQPRLQEPDGVVRLHRRPASLGVSGGAVGASICAAGAEWKWWCGIWSWRSWADEGDDSGRRPGHAPAAAHRRPPQGAGGSRRAHAAGDRALPACAPLGCAR